MSDACASSPRSRPPCLESMSVRELRSELARYKLDATGCVEKADLITKLRNAGASAGGVEGGRGGNGGSNAGSRDSPGHSGDRSSSSSASVSRSIESPPQLFTMPVAKIRRLIKRHGVENRVSRACEKHELVAVLADRLRQCPICLDDVATANTVTAGADSAHGVGGAVRGVGSTADKTVDACGATAASADGCTVESTGSEACRCCAECCTPFHRSCAAQHALAAAEAAKLPLLCPVRGCREPWPEAMIAWALNKDERRRYDTAERSLREQRSRASSGRVVSPRTEAALGKLGVRRCPKCGAGIEKQAAAMTHGCGKMTCRCGCKFCFQCGAEARSGDVPRCSCVGDYHSYLSHEDVLNNYASDPVIDMRSEINNAFNSVFGGGTVSFGNSAPMGAASGGAFSGMFGGGSGTFARGASQFASAVEEAMRAATGGARSGSGGSSSWS
eukprot:TRINITY_DN54686_c0_g1_i1.p1 TRINITY_DN54686_c0_g1~~TRINITY_DN54686_c0_g1_i1.p1  ORF type:complete len:446 (+),score=66.34 TRINITY_DN54686_c0_g1_i1:45-1382(+)